MHVLVALIGRPQNDSASRCGFCRARQSDWDEDPHSASRTKAQLVVRRCVDQQSATTKFHPYSQAAAAAATEGLASVDKPWNSVMAWSRAPLSVHFHGSCTSSDLYFVSAYEPSWNICRQMGNGSSVMFYPFSRVYRHIDYFTVFAQDRELSSWLPLPDEYACTDGKDYELVFSGARGGENVEISIHTGPASNSCRMLCISEQCDVDYRSENKIAFEMNANRRLTVQYKLCSDASLCDSNAYSWFTLLFGFRDYWPSVILMITERDYFLRATQHANLYNSTADQKRLTFPDTTLSPSVSLNITTVSPDASRIAAIATGCVVALASLVIVSAIVARRRACCAKRKPVDDVTFTRTAQLTHQKNAKNQERARTTLLGYRENLTHIVCTGNYYPSNEAGLGSTSRAGGFSRFSPPATLSPNGSLDEHIYCELDKPDAHYTSVTKSNDDSQYPGLV